MSNYHCHCGDKRCDVDSRRETQLKALSLAAWDMHEALSDALATPEDVSLPTLRKALSALGELLPAQRPLPL